MTVERDETPFETTSDIEVSRTDRYRAFVDGAILAPARIIWNDRRVRYGLAIVLLYFLAGTVGVMIFEFPQTNYSRRLIGPFNPSYTTHWFGLSDFSIVIGGWSWTFTGFWTYPLGTTGVGKGILALLVHSTPFMLKMIFGGVIFSTSLGTIWGTVAGYTGGRVDRVMMTISDIVMTIPGLPLIFVLAAVWTPTNPYMIGILLCINTWAGISRSLRSQVLTVRQESYVEASRTMGIGKPSIILKDVLPNLAPLIVVYFVTGARGIIFKSVGLYFIGILPFTSLNWGVMLNLAYKANALLNMDIAYWFIAPMVTVVLISLGLILLGQGLDRVFNPRIRARHAKTGQSGEGKRTDPAITDGGEAP